MKSQFKTPLKPSELLLAMRLAHNAKRSVMVWGAPGIGKSDLARQFANYRFPLATNVRDDISVENEHDFVEAVQNELQLQNNTKPRARKVAKIDTNYPVLNQETNLVDLRLAQVEPTDLRGIPVPVKFYVNEFGAFVTDAEVSKLLADGKDISGFTQKNQVVWAPPALLDLPRNWEGVIFLDEANQAIPVVQAAAYQLFLDRRIGELVLPDNAFVLAAGNRDGDGGVTFKLALPLRDRMTHIELRPDVEEWKNNYAIRSQVHPMVVGYISTNARDFNTLSTDDKNICGGSSPRSWVTVSDYLYVAESENLNKEERRVLWSLIEGTIGDDISGRFKTFYENVAKLPATMDILTGKIKNLDAYKNEIDISKGFTICLNLAYKVISTYEEFKEGTVKEDVINEYYNNMLQFLHESFNEDPELIMMTMKTIFMQKVFVNKSKIKFFVPFCKEYATLLFKSRESAYA